MTTVRIENGNSSIASASTTTSSSTYPCPILNRFGCPYDNKIKVKQQKQKGTEKEEDAEVDVDYLFNLAEIARVVEIAFSRAKRKETSPKFK
jgi:hypothetical protein